MTTNPDKERLQKMINENELSDTVNLINLIESGQYYNKIQEADPFPNDNGFDNIFDDESNDENDHENSPSKYDDIFDDEVKNNILLWKTERELHV